MATAEPDAPNGGVKRVDDQRPSDVDPVGRWPAPAAGGSDLQAGD